MFIVSTYDNPDPNCNMPCGSEGSLKFELISNKNLSCIAAFTIAIYGDLRDFGIDDVPEVEKWWKEIICKLDNTFRVRQAILQIYPEDSDKEIIYNEASYLKKNK